MKFDDTKFPTWGGLAICGRLAIGLPVAFTTEQGDSDQIFDRVISFASPMPHHTPGGLPTRRRMPSRPTVKELLHTVVDLAICSDRDLFR